MPTRISLPLAFSGASCLLAAYVALSLSGFFSLSRWKQHRKFVFIAISGSAFCLLDSFITLLLPVPAYLAIGRLELLIAGVHIALWLSYAADELGPLPFGLQRRAERAAVAMGFLYTLPVVGLTGRVRELPMPFLGVTLHTNETAPLGSAALLVMVTLLAVVVVRYGIATFSQRRGARLHFAGLMLLVLCGFNDALSALGLIKTPHLIDLGLCGCICLIGVALTQRWTSDIRALDELTASLGRQVEERSRALERAHAALARSDRLAAVGRLAGGMAHEINNPGAVLIANLEYLLAGSLAGRVADDAPAALRESLVSAQRICNVVRQLLVVSRTAAGDSDDSSFNLAAVAQQAVATVLSAQGSRVPIEVQVAADLTGRGRGLLLEQILEQLLSNAVLSIPPGRADGRVRLTASRDQDLLVVEVIDNGAGMDEKVREKLFEPFFTTRPVGEGAGLGLAVTLGLLRALGGEVRVESHPGLGTTMTLLLEEAPEPHQQPGAAEGLSARAVGLA